MDWKQQAKLVFNVPKPIHFGNYQHCCECTEHDQTLSTSDVDSIGFEQLGNPGWDPLCFSSAEGLMYYMPAPDQANPGYDRQPQGKLPRSDAFSFDP